MDRGSAENFFEQARAAMERGEPNKARDAFYQALRNDPSPELADDIHYSLGLTLAHGGDAKRALKHVRYFQARSEWLLEKEHFDSAVTVLQRALEIAPDNVRLIWHLGVALFYLGRNDEAIAQNERALVLLAADGKATPDSVSKLTTNIGIILGKQRRFAAAVERFDAAVKMDPSSAVAENAYGAALLQQHDYAAAAERYESALRKAPEGDPTRRDYMRSLGLTRMAQCRVSEALDCFQTASGLGPPTADLYFDWGNAFSEQRRYGEALEKFEIATRYDSAHWKAHHNIAECIWSQGRYRAGRERWNQAKRVYEQLVEAKRKRGDYLFFYWFGTVLSEIFRDFKRAREMFSIGRDASRDPLNSLGLASVCMDQRDVGAATDTADTGAEAWSELKRAEHLIKEDETWGRDPYVLRLLAEAQIRLGELDAAEGNLRIADATDAASAKIAADFGLIWMAREDYARARTSFQAAVLRNPRSLAIRTNLAQAYFKANVFSGAENEYKQLLVMTGEHIEAWLGLGDVYTALADRGDTERYADAVIHYSRGISLATGQAGQQVSNTKVSEAYYALGYVHVKISETSRDVSGKSEWIEARNAFRSCRALDPENYKAQRAIEKIDKHSNVLASPRWIDAATSGVIVALALFVFAVAQIGLLRGQPITEKAADASYVVLSLGSIILAIAGFYLPRVLKLKFGSLELEKSPADQVITPTALGIRL